MKKKGPAARPWEIRFLEKVGLPTGSIGCMEWLASRSRGGYGRFGVSAGNIQFAHRVSYRYFVAEIPEGLDLDHLCRNRGCVNPSHLEPVTRRVNLLRGETIPAARAAQTTCIHGHPFSDDNTRVDLKGRRHCRTCDQRWQDERSAKSPGRAPKTHCPQGHAYDAENTYVTRAGYKACRTCIRAANQRTTQRRRARKQAVQEA